MQKIKIVSSRVVFLQSGLGNQMFQYAFYLAKKARGENITCDIGFILLRNPHNGFELERVFDIALSSKKPRLLLCRILKRLKKKLPILYSLISFLFDCDLVEDTVPSVYSPSLLPHKGTAFYLGYWQTEDYFKEIRNVIEKTFQFRLHLLNKESQKLLEDIENRNSISIHIRRGDYFFPQYKSTYGEVCSLEYYVKAIERMRELVGNGVFYVFSNDIGWVKQNMNIPNPVFVDCNHGQDSWQDMCLMSHCKHNIIANSTFSWWGAWLNSNVSKVVLSPSHFLNTDKRSDIIPPDWIKIQI